MAIKIYTDGSCIKNPGKGTCAFVVLENNQLLHEQHYFEPATTNNRMELSAILYSMLFLIENGITENAIIHTDSTYALYGVTDWMYGWQKRNWIRGDSLVTNADLWQQIYAAVQELPNLRFVRVKGHSGDYWNDYTDCLCAEAYK